MKAPKIAEFQDKVTLCKIVNTVDSELNRIESVVPLKKVWACVTAKSSVIDTTEAGNRPEIRFNIIIRKQNIECDCVQYRGKTLRLVQPWIEVDNKYILIEAVDII